MTEPNDPARAKYYREYYRSRSYEETLEIKTQTVPPEITAIAHRHFESVMARASADKQRLRPFRVESRDQQLAYLRAEYGDARPQGIGINQGEYATIPASEVSDTNRFLATDGIIDCQGLVLVARDAQNKVTQTLLAHIDAKTSVARTLPELLAHMPKGSRIEATLLSSPNGYNYYLQSELMEALVKTPQISRIRHGFDSAHTIAVDTSTGHILTASGPYEALSEVLKINQWPIDIHFPEFSNAAGLVTSSLAEKFFRLQRQVPAFGLHRAYDAERGFLTEDALAQFVLERQRNDGQLDTNELREITAQIGATLNAQVQLAYTVKEAGLTTFTIQTPSGIRLDNFISQKIAPDLGSNGIIEAPNTPPAPGRAPATDTMSPRSGRVPTARQ